MYLIQSESYYLGGPLFSSTPNGPGVLSKAKTSLSALRAPAAMSQRTAPERGAQSGSMETQKGHGRNSQTVPNPPSQNPKLFLGEKSWKTVKLAALNPETLNPALESVVLCCLICERKSYGCIQ